MDNNVHKIIEGFGFWYVASHKPHLGWDTMDFQCKTVDEAIAYCADNGHLYRIFSWAERGAPEPDFGQDYSSMEEKEAAYNYWEA